MRLSARAMIARTWRTRTSRPLRRHIATKRPCRAASGDPARSDLGGPQGLEPGVEPLLVDELQQGQPPGGLLRALRPRMGVQQGDPQDPGPCLAEHLQRDVAPERQSGEGEALRRGVQHRPGHLLDRVRRADVRDDDVRDVGERRRLRRVQVLVAGESGHEDERTPGLPRRRALVGLEHGVDEARPGSASARASWSASSSAVVAREAGTPIPVARATKSRSGRRRSSSARARSPPPTAPTRSSSPSRMAYARLSQITVVTSSCSCAYVHSAGDRVHRAAVGLETDDGTVRAGHAAPTADGRPWPMAPPVNVSQSWRGAPAVAARQVPAGGLGLVHDDRALGRRAPTTSARRLEVSGPFGIAGRRAARRAAPRSDPVGEREERALTS